MTAGTPDIYERQDVPLPYDPSNSINMGSCFYWPPGPSRSKAYRRFDDALDTFEERAESFVVNITHGLRTIARKLDDKFGGDE